MTRRPGGALEASAAVPRVGGRLRSSGLRLAGFIALPALNALAPLLVLPAITAAFGQSVWVAVAVGQAAGSAGAVMVELGWGITGTQRVARQGPESRRYLLALVTWTKLAAFVPVVSIIAVAVPLVTDGHELEATAIAIAGALSGFNGTWVFIGMGRPSLILLVESLPRFASLVVAAAAIALGGSLWWFVGALLVPSVVSPLWGVVTVGTRARHFSAFSPRTVRRAVRGQASAFSARALSALYIALPVVLVGAVSGTHVTAVFGAVERLQRMALSGLQAFPNAMQRWVGGAADPHERHRRALRAVLLNGAVGVVAGLAFTVFAPWASEVVFSGVATVDHVHAALGSVLIVVVSFSRAVGGIALVTVRRVHGLAASAAAGALVGVPAILVLGSAFGVVGGLVGEVVAEVAVLAVQLAYLSAGGRDLRARSAR